MLIAAQPINKRIDKKNNVYNRKLTRIWQPYFIVLQGFKVHSRLWTEFGLRIYEIRVSFVRPNSKCRAKFADTWGKEKFRADFGALMPSLSLTLNVEPPGPDLTLLCSII
jgi:hypothetical protein